MGLGFIGAHRFDLYGNHTFKIRQTSLKTGLVELKVKRPLPLTYGRRERGYGLEAPGPSKGADRMEFWMTGPGSCAGVRGGMTR